MSATYRVYHSRRRREDGRVVFNFGDEISAPTINWLLRLRGSASRAIGVTSKCGTEYDVLAAGSVLQWAENRKAPALVWGTGIMNRDTTSIRNEALTLAAVRGPLTRRRVISTDLDESEVTLGDPGILASRVWPAGPGERHYARVGLVAHHIHHKHPLVLKALEVETVRLIDVNRRPDAVAREIRNCDLVLSSSLHGIIFADSYGVPNHWLRIDPAPTGGGFKFHDYFGSVRRAPLSVTLDGLPHSEWYVSDLIGAYNAPVDIAGVQSRLIAAFPESIPSNATKQYEFETDVVSLEAPPADADELAVFTGMSDLEDVGAYDRASAEYVEMVRARGYVRSRNERGFSVFERRGG